MEFTLKIDKRISLDIFFRNFCFVGINDIFLVVNGMWLGLYMMYFEIFVLRLEVKSRNILRRLYKVCWILLGNKNIVNVKKMI